MEEPDNLEKRLASLERRQGADETRERRRMFWQASGMIIALVTTAFLVWQTTLMHEQLKVQAAQLLLQSDSDYQTRRADLVARLYDRKEDCPEAQLHCRFASSGNHCLPLDLVCPLRADAATRAEALTALLALDRSRQRSTSLINVELAHMLLLGVDLHEVILIGADFSGSNLTGAILDGANLDHALFRAAELCTSLKLAEANWIDLDGAHTCPLTWDGFEFGTIRCPDGSVHKLICPSESRDAKTRYAEYMKVWNVGVDGQPGTTAPVASPADAGPGDAASAGKGQE